MNYLPNDCHWLMDDEQRLSKQRQILLKVDYVKATYNNHLRKLSYVWFYNNHFSARVVL